MQKPYRNITLNIVHELGKAILRGDFSSNDKLPTEVQLAEQFSVSRTATREAIKMLSAKGLISSKPRLGIKINDSKLWNLFDSDILDWVLDGKPDLFMLRSFLELRLAIESQAAFLAAKYAQEQDLKPIASALLRLKNAAEGADDSHEDDFDFHLSILSANKNPFFLQLKIFVATTLKINLRFTQRTSPVSMEEFEAHRLVYKHISMGDCKLAFEAALKTQNVTLDIVNAKIKDIEGLGPRS